MSIHRLGIFHEARKNIFWGQNKPLEPKNGIWGPKSEWSCGTFFVREFYEEQDKLFIWGTQRRRNAFRAQNQYSIHRLVFVHGTRKNILLRVKKAKISPNTELRPQKIKNKFMP
jgi:hypothetical protein